MAWQVSKRVWDSIKTEGDKKKGIDASERLMLLALADKADEQGICWPKHDTSYQTLGEMVGVNRRSAMRLIEGLTEAGHIWKSETVGRGHSNIFIVIIGLSEAETKERLALIGVTDDTNTNEGKVLPEAPINEPEKEMVLPVTQNGVVGDTNNELNGVTGNTQTIIETPSIPSLSSNDDSGQKPPEESTSEKWDKANKKIVGNRFLELTRLQAPSNKKTAGNWWGWLFELFEMGNKDPTETCRIMTVVVKYMQTKHLTISSPKSLHNLARAVVSGQELNGIHKNGHKTTQPNYRTGPPGAPVSASGLGEPWTEAEEWQRDNS